MRVAVALPGSSATTRYAARARGHSSHRNRRRRGRWRRAGTVPSLRASWGTPSGKASASSAAALRETFVVAFGNAFQRGYMLPTSGREAAQILRNAAIDRAQKIVDGVQTRVAADAALDETAATNDARPASPSPPRRSACAQDAAATGARGTSGPRGDCPLPSSAPIETRSARPA